MHRRGVAGDEHAPGVVVLETRRLRELHARPLAVPTDHDALIHRTCNPVRLGVGRCDVMA
eukprot:scaffold60996_cov84-Phaeocystis_antarctica.AAC.1